MSTQSEARFYRMGPPPVVTGDQLLDWVKRIKDTGIVDPSSEITFEVDYGKRIDRRHKTDDDLQIVSPPWWKRLLSFNKPHATISRFINHDHDVDIDAKSFDDLFDQFKGGSQSIQRANIMFWTMDEEVETLLSAPESEENPNTFTPFHLSLTVGPTILSDFDWDVYYTVGYVAMDIFGDGYFWPETFKQWVDRCTGLPKIQAACDICKQLWPTDDIEVDDQMLTLRKELENFWPYDGHTGPNDWAWGQNVNG